MADKKNPTNADLLKELRNMNQRLTAVENRWLAYDAAKEAVAEYKAQEKSEGRGKSTNTINQQLVKSLLAALSIISLLLTAWLAAK